MIRDNNYIQIEGWMINKLKLTGTELMVYALIYGFSQDGMSRFCGSAAYVAEWTGTSKVTVFSILKRLQEKNLIRKIERYENNVKYCEYSVILDTPKDTKPENPPLNPQEPKSKKEQAEPKKKEKLIEREPVNDLEKIEKAYLLNYEKLKQTGEVKTEEPIVNWGAARKLEKEYVQRYGLDVVLRAVKESVCDDFSVSSGYCLTTILSSGVLSRLVNGGKSKKGNCFTGGGVDTFTGEIKF